MGSNTSRYFGPNAPREWPKPVAKSATKQTIFESIDKLKEKLEKASEQLDRIKMQIEGHQTRMDAGPDHEYKWILDKIDHFHEQTDDILQHSKFGIK